MWKLVIDDLLLSLEYLPVAIIIGIFFTMILIMWNRLRKHSVNDKYKLVLRIVLCIYLVVLIQIVFLSREPGSRDGIDLRLFGTFTDNVRGNSYVVENIILFIPLGLLLPANWQRFKKLRSSILFGFSLSIFIEGIQLLTKRGYCQLDDVIMNTLGCAFGYLIWKFLNCIRVVMNKNRQ